MKRRLIIIGASGHGRVIADIAIKMNRWKEIAFLEDNDLLTESMGLKVIGKSTDASYFYDDSDIIVGIGDNATRETLQVKLEQSGASIPILVHPNAVIGSQVIIGEGTVVMAGVIINCCTSIGKGCIINTGSTVDHDCFIEDYVHISPGANLAGSVSVGKETWIGIGCTVIQNISITGKCKIGAGAVVTKNITESGTYIGIPAKKLDR